MEKIKYKLIFISLTFGIVITLVSSLFSHPNVVGANWWGYPLTWLTQVVVSPEYSPPLNVNWFNLIIDIIFWTIISLVIIFALFKKKMK
jgi:hypothetical protein